MSGTTGVMDDTRGMIEEEEHSDSMRVSFVDSAPGGDVIADTAFY
jgi:hypothetical protein